MTFPGNDINDVTQPRYDYTPSDEIPETAPSIFWSDNPTDLSLQVNQTLPRSDGGPIEAAKTAVVLALRDALQNTSIGIQTTNTQVHVTLEYPMKEEQYPGIWIQFQTSKLQRQGLSQEVWQNTATNNNPPQWQAIQEFYFEGKVTLTIMALTSLERDRISDSIISQLAFARTIDTVLTQSSNTNQYKNFLVSLYENPFISLTVNTDIINSGGQSVNMGTPWQEDVLAYVDSYSFDLLGQFMYVFNHDGTYTLANLNEYPAALPNVLPITPQFPFPVAPPVGPQYNVPIGGGPQVPSGDVN